MPLSGTLKTTLMRLAGLPLMLTLAAPAQATDVILETQLGDIEIELFDEQTPATVANFLKYIEDGDYIDSFFHRSVRGFIIQGGGFRFIDNVASAIPTDPAVINEPGISNTRGTISMAKRSGDVNSATSQWFINVGNNASQLDDQNGGFTVFGRVKQGMDVVDAINNLDIWNAGAPFGELPLIDFSGTGTIGSDNLVMSNLSVAPIAPEPEIDINQGMSDSWFSPATNGQGFFIVVYPEIKLVFLAWFTFDTERPAADVMAQLGGPGQRWVTAQGNYDGNRADLEVFVSSGGVFDQGTPVPGTVKDGTMTVEFSGCNSAIIQYDIPSVNRQGEVAVERVATDNVSMCEELDAQAAK